MRNVVLCGFMGCGKSTVGRLLAEKTGRSFVDMDAYIEKEAGMTVAAIFERYGEADFRRREREACAALAGQDGLVIAAGGGALTFPENAAALRKTGDIVLMRVTPETVLRRLEGDTTRPLLARPDKEAAVRELMAKRQPLYRQAAAFSVDANGDPASVAAAILAVLAE
ncbi:MAG: shikimate kinase [Acutalibacteraceae bacterium]|jgi:shikimate kinase